MHISPIRPHSLTPSALKFFFLFFPLSFACAFGAFCFGLRVSFLMVLLKIAAECRVDALSFTRIFFCFVASFVLPCILLPLRCSLLPCQFFLLRTMKQVSCTPDTWQSWDPTCPGARLGVYTGRRSRQTTTSHALLDGLGPFARTMLMKHAWKN